MLACTCITTILGRALIAWTGQGITAVLLGHSDDALMLDLQSRFQHASCAVQKPTGAALAWVRQVGNALNGETDLSAVIPLDLHGTPFQIKVWQALRTIPVGQCLTYRALAQALGQPSAVRAVAGACAANHIAVLVPCHRVIRSDGQLAGYRWGIEIKKRLLEREFLS